MPLRALSWLLFPHHIQLIRELYIVTEASASSDDQSQKGTQLTRDLCIRDPDAQ